MYYLFADPIMNLFRNQNLGEKKDYATMKKQSEMFKIKKFFFVFFYPIALPFYSEMLTRIFLETS